MAQCQALQFAGESDIEVVNEHVKSTTLGRRLERSAMLYNRLIQLLRGPALALHQSEVGGNVLTAWRLENIE